MTTTYHCCVDLGALIRGDRFAVGALRAFAEDMGDAELQEIVSKAAIKRAQGMEAWPLCGKHDQLGHCTGHPK
jgi:hypothetical protein